MVASRNFGSLLSLFNVIDNSLRTRVRPQASPIMSSLLVSGKRGELLRGNCRFLYFAFEKITLREKFLQFDWLRAVVFLLNLKYLHVKITNLLRVVV